MGSFALTGGTVIAPFGNIDKGTIIVSGKEIVYVGREESSSIPEDIDRIDVTGLTLVPGFVDIHIHGALGSRVSEGTEIIGRMCEYLPSTGVTAWLPTVGDIGGMQHVVAAIKEKFHGAEILGIHMEGPFLAPKNLPGTPHEEPHLPNLKEYEEMLKAGEGHFRLMGLAPELKGSLELIREMSRTGVVAAVAHSRATYDELMIAIESGLRHVTHTYNVMSGLHHRNPGVVGGALTCDILTAELIGDGFHVSPIAMEILLRCKGADKIALITDNTAYAGVPDGIYGELEKKNGVIRKIGFTENTDGTLAGSPWPMNHNFNRVMTATGRNIQEMVMMSSTVPAKVAGVLDKKGTLEVGKDADLVALNNKGEVEMCFVGGEIAYKRGLEQ